MLINKSQQTIDNRQRTTIRMGPLTIDRCPLTSKQKISIQIPISDKLRTFATCNKKKNKQVWQSL